MLLIVGNLKLGGEKAYQQSSLGLTFVCTETELMKSEEGQMVGDYIQKLWEKVQQIYGHPFISCPIFKQSCWSTVFSNFKNKQLVPIWK